MTRVYGRSAIALLTRSQPWSELRVMRGLSFALLLTTATLLRAADPAAKDAVTMAGHSGSGEAFNEGPRQKAVLLPGMGTIHFPISTNHPEAQKFFGRASPSCMGLGVLS